MTWIKLLVIDKNSLSTYEVKLLEYNYDTCGDVSEIKDYRVLSKTGEVIDDSEYAICSYEYDAHCRTITMEYTDSTDSDSIKEAYTSSMIKRRLLEETLQNLYPTETEDKQDEVRTYLKQI